MQCFRLCPWEMKKKTLSKKFHFSFSTLPKSQEKESFWRIALHNHDHWDAEFPLKPSAQLTGSWQRISIDVHTPARREERWCHHGLSVCLPAQWDFTRVLWGNKAALLPFQHATDSLRKVHYMWMNFGQRTRVCLQCESIPWQKFHLADRCFSSFWRHVPSICAKLPPVSHVTFKRGICWLKNQLFFTKKKDFCALTKLQDSKDSFSNRTGSVCAQRTTIPFI